MLVCSHNVDGAPTEVSLQAYVNMLDTLRVDSVGLIDSRVPARSQASIDIAFMQYNTRMRNITTTAAHKRTVAPIGEINAISSALMVAQTTGTPIHDPRGWSRYIGYRMQGPQPGPKSRGTSRREIAIIFVHGPCKASSLDTPDAPSDKQWHTQAKSMQRIRAAEREEDPRFQFLRDLHNTVDKLAEEGVEIVITGDWNIPALNTGPDKYREKVAKLFKKDGMMLDVHTACNRTYKQPTNPIAAGIHGAKAKQRHTYHHPGSTGTVGSTRQAQAPAYTNPDMTIASRSLLTNNIISQCATLLDYNIAGSGHLPTMFTINLAAAFDTTRSRFITQKYDRAVPVKPNRSSVKISLANSKHSTAFTKHVDDHVPERL
jgi:hypothetical protein